MVAAIPQAIRKPPGDGQGKAQPNNNGAKEGRGRVRSIPSRYLSPSHSTSSNTTSSSSSSSSSSAILKRYPSPLLSRTTTSTRSLSVSFQGEAFFLPVSKKKETAATPVSHRKPTPERRRSTPLRDQRENSKPLDRHQLWPGASRRLNSEFVPNMDCDSDNSGNKLGFGFVGRSMFQRSSVSVDGRLSLELGDETNTRLRRLHIRNDRNFWGYD